MRSDTGRIPGGVFEPFRGVAGSQLVEFALALPFLVVLLIGILDFGQAYNLKQKLNNAAREGTRLGASESTLDLGQSNPPSVTAIRDVVQNYMTNAGLTQCTIAATGTKSGLQWTYAGSGTGCGNFSLVIDRGYTFANGTTTVVATHVTLTYPYTWTFGRVIGLLVKGANPGLPSTISTDTIMQNLP